MKKILSIFSLLCVTVFGTIMTEGGIACKSSSSKPTIKKLDLNNLKISGGIKVTKETLGLEINGSEAYLDVENQIITQYNTFFTAEKRTIANSDFNLASNSVTNTKSWAIAIENGSSTLVNTTNVSLGISATNNLVNKNNTLNLKITTNNKFVVGTNPKKSITKQINLDKFVFNNQDANKNHDLQIARNKAQPEFKKEAVIDLSAETYHLDGLSTALDNARNYTVNRLLEVIERKKNDVKLTNAVIDNLNLARARINPTGISVLPQVDSSSQYLLKNPSSSDSILKIYTRINDTHAFLYLSSARPLTGDENEEVYLQINISNWDYLSADNHNFICPNETYVYAYVGIARALH